MRAACASAMFGAAVTCAAPAAADPARKGQAEACAICLDRPRTFVALGFGPGGLSGGGDDDWSQGVATSMQIGYRLWPRIHLLYDNEITAQARYAADPDVSQQQSAFTVGVRMLPFGERWPACGASVDVARLYVKAGIGVGHIIRVPDGSFDLFDIDQGSWGPAATGGVGFTPLVGRGGSLGLELSASAVFHDDGTRNNVGLNLVASLDFL